MNGPLGRRTDLLPPEPSPLRALVVDDDENYRFYIGTIVARFGFNVTQAADGESAIELLRDATYDLLVVDCEMPRGGGIEFIQNVRATDRYAEVYAVMLTGRKTSRRSPPSASATTTSSASRRATWRLPPS